MSKFWKKFDDMMDALSGYIDDQISKVENNVNIDQSSHSLYNSVSTSTIIQNGKKIIIETKNGKITIKMNGKEYVEKK